MGGFDPMQGKVSARMPVTSHKKGCYIRSISTKAPSEKTKRIRGIFAGGARSAYQDGEVPPEHMSASNRLNRTNKAVKAAVEGKGMSDAEKLRVYTQRRRNKHLGSAGTSYTPSGGSVSISAAEAQRLRDMGML